MKKRISALIAILAVAVVALAAGTGAAPAQDVGRIVAVVNDDPITYADLDGRIRLALVSSGLQATPENQQRLLPQVLRLMIDEKLQVQEAERSDVTIADAQVDEALNTIARQNNTTAQQLFATLKRSGVPESALVDQVRSQLAWRDLVRARYISRAQVGDSEIDAVVERLRANQGKPEYLLAEIFLSVDDAATEAQVRQFADRLIAELRRGAPFPAVARQFSQAAGAQNGGDMGWIVEGQLEPALDQTIRQLQPGEVSTPVRTLTGYHILLLRDKRTVNVDAASDPVLRLYQLVVPLAASAPAAAAQTVSRQMTQDFGGVNGCEAFQARATEVGVTNSIDAGEVPLSRIPADLRPVVQSLPDGELSQPQRIEQGVAVLMICSRRGAEAGQVDRDAIRASLTQQKIEMLQRRLLRDLRNAAFVDMRL
jgi:peptidyl-prolyl cis-trans isomerase SurA